MTNRIDRLEERDLVQRHRSPDDRRGVLVELTEVGLRRVDDAMTELLQVEAGILDVLPAADRSRLAALLRVVVGPFEG